MGRLTPEEIKWLARLSDRGTWPDRPFLRDEATSASLMRKGLVELVAPPSPYLRYAAITPAGRRALNEEG